jgi:hypothetical protein
MKLKNLFLVNSAVTIIFALVLLLMPAFLLDLFGMPDRPQERLLAHFFGAQLLGAGLITLFARNTKELRSQRSLTLAFFIADGIGFIVAVGGLLSGAMNAMGLLLALGFLLFAIGFGYFQFL